MSSKTLVRQATLDRFGDAAENIKSLHLRNLPPFTTLIVRTRNSWYRVVITDWPKVFVQGGAFFRDPTPAYLDGANIGGSLREGWIGVDRAVEFRTRDRLIITTPVSAITTEQPPDSVVH